MSFLKSNNDAIKRINLYLVYLISFSIPFYIRFIPPLIILWLVFTLIEGNFKQKIKINFNIEKNYYFFPAITFFMLIPIGLLWTNNMERGYFDVEEKLSLLVFPILFAVANEFIKKKRLNLLKLFIFGNFLASVICVFVAFYNSLSILDSKIIFDAVVLDNDEISFVQSITWGGNYFFYSYFSIFHHATYFSAYLSLCMIFIFYILEKGEYKNKKYRNFYIILAFFFVLILLLLSSKAGLIVLSFILLFILVRFIFNSKKIVYKIAAIFVLLSLVLFVSVNPRVRRIKTEIEQYAEDGIPRYSLAARMVLWKNSLKLINENFVLGVGTGDVQDELMKKVGEDEHNKIITDVGLNCHNQYLETFVSHGIVGFIILLFLMIFPIKVISSNIKLIYLGFLFIVGINFLFETMLNTFAGILFFTFFINFFVFIYGREKSEIRS